MLLKPPLWINRGTNVNLYYFIDNQMINKYNRLIFRKKQTNEPLKSVDCTF